MCLSPLSTLNSRSLVFSFLYDFVHIPSFAKTLWPSYKACQSAVRLRFTVTSQTCTPPHMLLLVGVATGVPWQHAALLLPCQRDSCWHQVQHRRGCIVQGHGILYNREIIFFMIFSLTIVFLGFMLLVLLGFA